jgi:hypothetical protein
LNDREHNIIAGQEAHRNMADDVWTHAEVELERFLVHITGWQ